jgi:hypothetical protein
MMQTREWKLATITNVTNKDIELDSLINKAVLVKVEDNLEAVCKRQRTLKKQYLDVIRNATDSKAVFDKVVKQLVTIKL